MLVEQYFWQLVFVNTRGSETAVGLPTWSTREESYALSKTYVCAEIIIEKKNKKIKKWVIIGSQFAEAKAIFFARDHARR